MNRKEVKLISADMTMLDIVSAYPGTEAVFRSYDENAEECICCRMLFETVQQIAEKYKLDLSKLLAKLNAAVAD
jgi:iron-sulfur cluster repair protein YtfE (RIC family)